MTAKSHILTTMNIGSLPLFYMYGEIARYTYFESLLFLVGLFIGSLFPDIDEPNSFIGKRFSLTSSTISMFIKHRTITHNVLFLIPALVYFFITQNIFFFGLFFGAVLHTLEDSITNSSVPILKHIIPKRIRFNTNGKFERIFYLPFLFFISIININFILELLIY